MGTALARDPKCIAPWCEQRFSSRACALCVDLTSDCPRKEAHAALASLSCIGCWLRRRCTWSLWTFVSEAAGPRVGPGSRCQPRFAKGTSACVGPTAAVALRAWPCHAREGSPPGSQARSDRAAGDGCQLGKRSLEPHLLSSRAGGHSNTIGTNPRRLAWHAAQSTPTNKLTAAWLVSRAATSAPLLISNSQSLSSPFLAKIMSAVRPSCEQDTNHEQGTGRKASRVPACWPPCSRSACSAMVRSYFGP